MFDAYIVVFTVLFLFMIIMGLMPEYSYFRDNYLLAGRNVDLFTGASSIAITWVWAPALFVGAKLAYLYGVSGFMWFIVPNFLTLWFFSFFAQRICILHPHGVTLTDHIRCRYGDRVGKVYTFELSLMSLAATAVQLLAGGKVLSYLTGADFFLITLLLGIVPLIYTFARGFAGSVATDKIQYGLTMIVLLFVIPYVWYNTGPIQNTSFSGVTPDPDFMWKFGIPMCIGLLAGAFGSQEYWQRAYSLGAGFAGTAFRLAAFLFVIVPLSIGSLGFIAVAQGLEIADPFLTNLAVIEQYGQILIIPFVVMLTCGLISTIDSAMASVASIVSSDLDIGHRWPIWSRNAMILLIIIAIGLANIPGMQVLYFFCIYGMIRASVLVPTLLSFTNFYTPEPFVYYGILTSMILGVPAFTYAMMYGVPTFATLTAISVVAFPLMTMVYGSITYR